MDHHDAARSTANQRQTRAEYELIEHPGASRSPSASDRRGSFPVHIVRGVCDSVFRLAHGRAIGAYIERAVRPYAGGIWPAMAQAPPRRRTFTYRLLVSGLFGSCHHGRFLPGRHVGRRSIRDAIVGSAARDRRSGGCHHCGVVLVCADGHHRVRAHPLGSSHAIEPSCAERSMSDAAELSNRMISALGHKRTWQRILLMSALPPKADIGTQSWNVRFAPKADIAWHGCLLAWTLQ